MRPLAGHYVSTRHSYWPSLPKVLAAASKLGRIIACTILIAVLILPLVAGSILLAIIASVAAAAQKSRG
jgi:hypothetical protein